jgi:hypothetical protein
MKTCGGVDLSVYLWLYSPLLDLGRFFSFLIFYRVGLLGRGISLSQGRYLHIGEHRPIFQFLDILHSRAPWTGDQPVARPLPAYRRAQTSVLQVRLEPTIPVFERAKAVHALDCADTDRPGVDL